MNIKLAEKNDIATILDILNKATLKLLSKDIKQWTYPWPISEVEDQIAQGQVFKYEIENDIVGTFIIKPILQLNNLSIRENSLYVGRIAIIPEYQGKNIGASIIDYCQSISVEQNRDMYLDCWAGNNKLKDFYNGCGLNYLGDFPVDDYFVSIFQF
ncbi:GNAT family N-acetyltransferase [Psychrobacillus sp. FSL K6-1267]|uniref:GNAT family N-acetyltransferase n=1 Tax=Psychrobacillus sp. FSL K6-1267 TaxID=2921543 RepID=UPI00119DC264